MPSSGRGTIIIKFPEKFSIWINQKDYTDYYTGFEFIEQKNLIGKFQLDLVSITDVEKADVAEGKDVQLRFANNLVFKGTIESPEYKSYEFATVSGFGTVETYLKNATVEWRRGKSLCDPDSSTGRPVYTFGSQDPDSATISGASSIDIIGGQISGVSAVSVNTNDYLGNIVARSDQDNILSFVDGVVRNLSGVWWTSYGDWPYDNNFFNVSTTRGTGDPIKVFNVSGDNQNSNGSKREIDEEVLWNSITLLGYGDGNNQIKSVVYHGTDNFTRLDLNCDISDETCTVQDGNVLSDDGTVWIGMEKCNFTRLGDVLTISGVSGESRFTKKGGTDLNSYDHLSAYSHSRDVVVFDATYTEASTDGNSRIDDNGLRQKTIIDKSVLNQDALDQGAVNILVNHYDLRERIKIIPSDLYECLEAGLKVGDTVTVNDVDSGLSGNYVIVGQKLRSNEGFEQLEYELNNTGSTFTQDLRETQSIAKISSQYMQGATTAFNVQSYENCDNTNPLNIRVYLPPDIINLNKAILSFKIKDYRSYTSASESNTDSTNVFTEAFTSSTDSITSSWKDILTTQPTSDTFELVFYSWWAYSSGDTNLSLIIRIYDQTRDEYYPNSSGDLVNLNNDEAHTTYIVPWNMNGHTVKLQAKSLGATTNVFNSHAVIGHGTHTHNMDYAITTSGVVTQTIDLKVGIDGKEGIVETGLSDQTEYDITDWMTSGITLSNGNWMNIQLIPPAGNPLRVEANLFLKCFIQSK